MKYITEQPTLTGKFNNSMTHWLNLFFKAVWYEYSRTRSYKKGDEPLLNLTGAMSSCLRENQGTILYTKGGLVLLYEQNRGWEENVYN
jgi:hypothetical protein